MTPRKPDNVVIVFVVVFFLLELEMSDEIKSEFDDINIENNQEDEQTEETTSQMTTNGDEENELPLATPDGGETPSVVSFADIIVETQNEEPPTASADDHAPELLQTISEKSNKDASSTILNTVKNSSFFFLTTFRHVFLLSLSMEISIWTKITLFKSRKVFRNSFPFFMNYHRLYKLKF